MNDGPQPWFFDAWSRIYDFPVVQLLTYRPVHDVVMTALRLLQPRRVLDLACGTGLLTNRLHRELPGAAVFGCDFSFGMLQHAHRRGGDIGFVRGNALELPFRNGALDAIVSTEAFHWFPDQSAALRECRRLLRPGGKLLVALVNTPSEVLSSVMHVGSQIVGQPFYWPTTGHMKQMVEDAGFHVERQQRIFRVPGFLLPPVLTMAVRP